MDIAQLKQPPTLEKAFDMAKNKINVDGKKLRVIIQGNEDYICITDMVKGLEATPNDYVKNWLQTISTISFLEAWEQANNRNFKTVESHRLRNQFGEGRFIMSVKKWVDNTNAIGIISEAGRYGGTYAHSHIAIHFANWFDSRFYVYLIREFIDLKKNQFSKLGKKWDVNRYLSKVNYSIHTEAVRESLPLMIQRTKKEAGHFASEADLLNEIVFGMTAKQWRTANPKLKGNIRDHANTTQLHVLANLEVLNAKLLELAFNKDQRYQQLKEAAEKHFSIIQDKKPLK